MPRFDEDDELEDDDLDDLDDDEDGDEPDDDEEDFEDLQPPPNQIGALQGEKVVYAYRCVACGDYGTLEIPTDERGLLGCPNDCWATYVQWRNPMTQAWTLTCVVQPIALPVKH